MKTSWLCGLLLLVGCADDGGGVGAPPGSQGVVDPPGSQGVAPRPGPASETERVAGLVEPDQLGELERLIGRYVRGDAPVYRGRLQAVGNGRLDDGPVSAALSSGLVSPGSVVGIRADVSDETFIRVNDATVTAMIQKPNGDVQEADLHWTVDKDGEYSGEFRAEERGVHEVRVVARRAGKALGEDVAHVRVADLQVEFRGAEMRGDLLRRIATETACRFYTPGSVSQLAEDLTYSPKTATVVDEKELWDMPAIFLGVLVSLCMEWLYRKHRGLA